MSKSKFYAYLSRMKHIYRWQLMRNSQNESLSVHSFDTAVIAHALGLLRIRKFNKECDVNRLVLLALYHDCSEIITGDMPTPVKYYNPEIKTAYKSVEKVANNRLADMAPDELKDDYRSLLDHSGEDKELLKLLKAADKISAIVKCIEEENSGNHEFVLAKQSLLESVRNMNIAEANYYIDECLPSYGLTLDEIEPTDI